MRKIVFLSSMALDANISLIKRLRLSYDIYYVILGNDGIRRLGNIQLDHIIVKASTIALMHKLNEFVDLDKTYIIKNCPKFSLWKLKIEIETHKLIKRIKPDVILTDAPNPNFLIDRFIYRKRIISLIHDPFLHSGELTLIRKFGNYLLIHWAREYVLFNKAQEEEFIYQKKLNKKDVFTIFLGQYEFLTLFSSKNFNSSIKTSKFSLLFFGRISPYKGLKYLLDGFMKFLNVRPNEMELIIAGNGDFDFAYYRNIPQIHIINRFINTDELANMIQQASIVICPYTDATQSGVVMSAYAFKKPVLATNVGGLPEMLNQGKTGMLIPPRNSDAIYKALITLSSQPNLLDEYSKNIERIYFNSGEKSWEKAADKLKTCIESFL